MRIILRLAWRNLWRNRRRTLITAASIFMAIFLALIMRSMQLGTYSRMIENIVHLYSGYIQVHKKGYWEEKEINNSFPLSDSLLKKIRETRNVSLVIPRLESFALASSGQKTKGMLILGTDPGPEDQMARLSEKMVAGRFLTPDDNGLVLGKQAAAYLNLSVDDTIVLIGQGYHGVSAAGKFPVRGIIHLTSPDLDKQTIYMSLPAAQYFFSAGNNVTSLSLNIRNPDRLNATAKAIRSEIDPEYYEVMTWDEMMVEIVQYIETDSVSGLVMIWILYLIIGFGIFGTVLMMTVERLKEFAVMISLGTKRAWLTLMVSIESIFIGFLGVISGALVTVPIILYFVGHPIRLTGDLAQATEVYGFEALLCFEPPSMYYLNNSLLVLVIVLIAAIYPVRKIVRLNLINALHNKL